MPVPFWISEDGYRPITNGSDIQAVLSAFHSWEAVSSADVHFAYRGTTAAHIATYDGINMVSFSDNTTALPASVIAVTLSYFKTQKAQVVFDESDIIINPAFAFSTSGESDKFDIQSILTHEIGHFLGLDHAAMVSSVMVPFGKTGLLDQRTLQYDDVAAISEIYPKVDSTYPVGEIQGSVVTGALPVFGANIVAIDSAGTSWVSTLSQPSGSFDLKFLPPGTYTVLAEPLNQAVTEQNLSRFWYQNLNINFAPTYYGNVSNFSQAQTIEVAAGAVTGGILIQAPPANATGLNLTRPGFGFRVPRGASGTMTIGGYDITPGTQFSTSTADIFLDAPAYGGIISSTAPTSATMNISVSPNAVFGAKNIIVMRGAEASIVNGGIVLVDVEPNPVDVLPASGPTSGGTTVTIIGSNFRPGAQVSFGGLMALDVNVINDGTIAATTPPNSPGAANVLVVNADGTSAVIPRGFTFLPPTPTITSVSPASGPPSSTVTVIGTGFDTHTQNLDVQFNGADARIVGATSSTITVVVPYGAKSGTVTVSIFGVTATGAPNFDVTAAPASANHAVDTYNFVDASTTTGGTVLTFKGPDPSDDGLATVQLPFTFSLFENTYFAGSPITISTNGWISLEPFDDPYAYENGPLPGKSAVDYVGVARTIPPSLIAPFHDDLLLIPGVSSISTKIIGTAPNRQFVVQYTRLTILDETGRDQNASITFEAILFEGSNDIQFVYQNAAGAGSDASSATIGIQNLSRDTAVLTSFNQPTVHSGLFFSYHFDDGTYATSTGTLTPAPNTVSVIPYAPESASEFSGIALFAPSAMSVVLKAFDPSGNLISGGGVQNPVTLSLSAGQQYARLIQELFGLQTFNGWIQVEASGTGLGIYTSTGFWNLSEMDGSAARATSTDFVLFHIGASAYLVNPTPRIANVTIRDFGGTIPRTITIGPLSQVSIPVTAISRVQSTEALASVERFGVAPRLAIATPPPATSAQTSFVIPYGVIGAGYVTTLSVTNLSDLAGDATISFAGVSKVIHVKQNSAMALSLADFLQIPITSMRSDAVRIDSSQPLLAVVDVQDPVALVSLGTRPAATDMWFPEVLQGNGLFTELTLASGAKAANVTVEVYSSVGGTPRTVTFTLNANQQTSKLVSEIIGSATTQTGGSVHIHSDQPIWSWAIYGSATIMASGPPL
jgi:hypothetical protein